MAKKRKKEEEKLSNNPKAIQSAIDSLEKRFKEPMVMKMSDAAIRVDTFSSGRLDLDNALGGGYPVGKIVELYAESGVGKTGLALEAIKSIQSEGGVAAIVDAEHALNTEYAEQIGICIDDLYISQPSTGEQAFEVIRALIETKEIDLIVVDSVSAMIPRAELEGESGEVKMGLQARLMSQGMKLITGASSDSGTTVIFINQLRTKIGGYVAGKVTSGGNALKYYASQRLEIKSKGRIKEGDDVIGFKQLIKVVKNKIAPPFKEIENDIIYGVGVDSIAALVETAVIKGILDKRGAYFYYQDVKLAQGLAKLRDVLNDNPELVEELEMKIKEWHEEGSSEPAFDN